MANNLNIYVTGYYQVVDVTTGTVYVTNRGFNIVLPANGSYDAQYITVGTTPIALPVASLAGTVAGLAYTALVINHGASSNLIVSYTQFGESPVHTCTLAPGDMWIKAGDTETVSAAGFNFIELAANTGTVTAEYLIAA